MTGRKSWLACAGLAMLLSGCVERRFIVNSYPTGAKVYVDDKPVGFTPCEVPFIYYGKHRFQLELDGHETRIENIEVRPPWYEYPPLDFLAENVYPFKLSDIQRFDGDKLFVMTPLRRPNLDALRAEAEELREKAKQLPPPSHPIEPAAGRAPPPAAAVPPAVVPPAARNGPYNPTLPEQTP